MQSKVLNRDEILVKNALKLKYEVDINLGEKTEKKYADKLQTALDIYNHKLGSPRQSVKQQFQYQQESIYHPLAMSNILLPIKLPRNSPMHQTQGQLTKPQLPKSKANLPKSISSKTPQVSMPISF